MDHQMKPILDTVTPNAFWTCKTEPTTSNMDATLRPSFLQTFSDPMTTII